MSKMIRTVAVVVLVMVGAAGWVLYMNCSKDQAAFESMGEAQLLREQLRQPEESK